MAVNFTDPQVKQFYDQLNSHVGNAIAREPLIRWTAPSETFFQELTKRFLDKRNGFQRQGKPIGVQIAYHYTTERKIVSIGRKGLLATKAVRGSYGHGIYVGNNPIAFRSYGEIGLICLILVGTQKKMYDRDERSNADSSVNSFHGNKVCKNHSFANVTTYYDEIVLRDGSQVLPLFQFHRELSNNAGYLWETQTALQDFVDANFPSGWPASRVPIYPNYQDLKFEWKLAKCNNYSFASSLSNNSNPYNRVFAALASAVPVAPPPPPPTKISWGSEICNPVQLQNEKQNIDAFCTAYQQQGKEECPICLSSLNPGHSAVSIKKCKHSFHRECLHQALKSSNKCPMCRIPMGESGPSGKSPYGSLIVTLCNNIHCGGFGNIPTICLRYDIPSGTQTAYHENPGYPYKSTTRTAYVPYTEEGHNLVKRLRYAFRRGLTFTVGTSLTSGRSNTVVWASIHHKTVLSGGMHGWPDPAYFANVNSELDGLNVPKASSL